MAGRKEYELLFKLQASLGANYTSAFKVAQSEMARLQGSLTKTQKAQANVQSYQKMNSAISGNKNKLAELKLEHDRLAKEIKATETPSKKLTKEFENNENQIIKTKNAIERQETSLKRLKTELGKVGVNTYNLDASNQRLAKSYELIKKEQETVAKYQMTQAQVAKITEAQEQNNIAIAKAKNSMLMTAGAATALGTAIYQGPVKSAMELESQMADVSKVVDWINKKGTPEQIASYKELKNTVLDVTTQIPMTAEEISAIMEAAGQSNVATDNSGLVAFTKDAAKMGIAFDSTSAQAGEWMAKWRTSFKMSQTDVVALSDKINYLGNTSAANARQISEVVTKIGPLGDVAGVASGEIAAIGTAMISTGVQEDVAATGIKNFILALNAGSSATKSQVAVLDKLKLNTTEVAKSMQTDAKGAILDVLGAIKKLPEAEQAASLTKLFGKESVAAIAPLLTNLDYLDEQFVKVGDSSKYAGSMEAEYAARADTRQNKIMLTANKIKKAMMTTGEALLPLVDTVAEGIGDFAEKFAEWAEKNPETIQNLVELSAKLLALKLGGDAAKVGFLSVKNGVLTAQKAIKLFNASTATTSIKAASSVGGMAKATGLLKKGLSLLPGPLGWVAGGIGAVTAGITIYKAVQEKLRRETLEFSKDLVTAADAYQEVSDKSASTKALTEEYRKLELKTKDVATSADEVVKAKERMKDIEDELIEQNPDVISKYDKENGKIAENLDLLDEKADREQEISKYELEKKQREAAGKLPKGLKEASSLSNEAIKLDAEHTVSKNVRDELQKIYDEWYTFDPYSYSREERDAKSKELVEKANKVGLQNIDVATGKSEKFNFSGMDSVQNHLLEFDEKTRDLEDKATKVQEKLSTVNKSIQDYYDTSVQVVENDLGGSLKSVAVDIEKKQAELDKLIKNGEGSSAKASELKTEISSRESDLVNAAAEIRDYGVQVQASPDTKTIDVTDALKDYQDTSMLEFSSQIKGLEAEIAKKQKELSALYNNGQGNSKKASSLRTEVSSKKSDLINTADELKNYQGIMPKIDAIHQSENTMHIVQETNAQIDKLSPSIVEFAAGIKGLKAEIAKKQDELSALNSNGQGNSEKATILKGSISSLESKYKTAIKLTNELGIEIEKIPEVKAVNVDESVKNIDNYLKKISEIPSEKTTKISTINKIRLVGDYFNGTLYDDSGNVNMSTIKGKIPGYASGGIITEPTLSTFAERCPEAAIPLDGSARSRALWEYTGRVQGFKAEQAGLKFARENAMIYANMPANEITAPVVEGGYSNNSSQIVIKSSPVFNVGKDTDISEIEQVLQQHDDEMINKLLSVIQKREHDERRTRYE